MFPRRTVEIKFRPQDLLKTAHRLDPELISLDARLRTAVASAQTEVSVAMMGFSGVGLSNSCIACVLSTGRIQLAQRVCGLAAVFVHGLVITW